MRAIFGRPSGVAGSALLQRDFRQLSPSQMSTRTWSQLETQHFRGIYGSSERCGRVDGRIAEAEGQIWQQAPVKEAKTSQAGLRSKELEHWIRAARNCHAGSVEGGIFQAW